MHVSHDPRVGTELAGYRIERFLGRGGMSVVYLAEDLRLGRSVALKVLAAELSEDEVFRERFLRESELAASIDHPNIVPIFEAGAADDVLFIAMRYVPGRDLRERLLDGALDPADAIGIVAQVASALDAAHARGLVHRDVKPSNVLLDLGARPDGSDHVYLADFGLTRRVSDEPGFLEDGHLLGTVAYVAPEQIAGEELDGRADVYSLGCVVHECLVGEPPFDGGSELAVVFAHLEADPPPPSTLRPELPAALDGVVARALEKDPERRYPTCSELARAALAVAVDEASRVLVDVASRAAAGRSDLSHVEAELAGKVVGLQAVREQERALAGTDTPARAAAEGVCPFKGLASFEPVDADYFFGRERLVGELVARLVGAGLLAIVGPSGSGKSSVLGAGLLPALAGGVLPGSGSWRRVLLRPGPRPLEELRRVLVTGARDPLDEALDALPPGGRLLLAVDQLEEVFTACESEAHRAGFVDTLVRAATDRERRGVVLAAVRADFYGRFAAYQPLAELLGANHVLVGPMQASELRRAVELPAARVGLSVERELTDELVDDVEGEPGALPLLSTALLELWQRRDGDSLTLAAYRESGGVRSAVARLAERTYARVPDARRPLVRAIMLRLVADDEADVPVRRRVPLAELDLDHSTEAAGVLDVLADSRLVTVGDGYVEVAHEALLREWPRLREWIEEDAEDRRLRRHITQAATEWAASDRDQGELYRGARLGAALDWTADHALELNELEREFVTESRDASEQEAKRERSTNRRLRALLLGAVLLLVAAAAGGTLALVQRGEARDAEAAQLAQRLGAQALVEDDLGLSLLLARQAVAIDDSPQTRGYLLAALHDIAAVGIVQRAGDAIRGIAVSPDGETLAVLAPGAGLLLYDARTLEQTGQAIEVPSDLADRDLLLGEIESVAYSPDGTGLAFGGPGYLVLLDARTREVRARMRLEGGGATRLAFSNDGEVLAVLESPGDTGLSADALVTIRDAATLRPIGAPMQPPGFVGAFVAEWWTDPGIALTPDGRSLVTLSPLGDLSWWDLDRRTVVRAIEVEDASRTLALSPDGSAVAVGLDDGILLVDVRTGGLREARGVLASAPLALLFSPDGETLVSTSHDGSATVWSVDALAPVETFEGHSAAVPQAAFSPDGRTLYTASHDGTAIAWDVSGNRRLGRSFVFTHDRGRHDWPDWHPGVFSPDGRVIAVGLKKDGIALWDADRLAPLGRPLRGTDGEVSAIAFTPDGQTLVAVAENGRATVWDVGSRSIRHGPFTADGYLVGLGIDPDGTSFATAGTEVRVWDVETAEPLARWQDIHYAAGDVAFSPTDPLLALTHEGINPDGGAGAEIWDVALESRLRTLDTGGGREYFLGWAVAFSPDGRLLASSGLRRTVDFWDVRSGARVGVLEHDLGEAVHSLDFSPDGTVLAMSGGDSFASLWDVAHGTQIGPRLVAGGRGATVDLSPDGRRLLQTHASGEGAVWDVDPESWKQRACAVANRTLTREEWEEYLPGRPYEPACAS